MLPAAVTIIILLAVCLALLIKTVSKDNEQDRRLSDLEIDQEHLHNDMGYVKGQRDGLQRRVEDLEKWAGNQTLTSQYRPSGRS